MARILSFSTVDVFTEVRFAGNPLAIVEDADGLSTETMQAVAREFNLSETIFVQKPDHPAHTAKVRIFFPAAEIPFAGHPTIGCAIHLARKRSKGLADFETRIVLEELAGLVPVMVSGKSGTVTAQLTAPVIPFANPGQTPDPDMAAAALGLDVKEIGFGSHVAGRFEGGPAFLFIPLASRAALARACPAEPGWSRMTEFAGLQNAYVYAPGGVTGYHARMFAPGHGIPEDPATGSASAILAAQLLAAGELSEGENRYTLQQGHDMGRPSRIGLEVDVGAGAISAVRISGSAVSVSSGAIELD